MVKLVEDLFHHVGLVGVLFLVFDGGSGCGLFLVDLGFNEKGFEVLVEPAAGLLVCIS